MWRYTERKFSVTPLWFTLPFSLCQHKKGHHLEVRWGYLGTSVSCAAGCRPTQQTSEKREEKQDQCVEPQVHAGKFLGM